MAAPNPTDGEASFKRPGSDGQPPASSLDEMDQVIAQLVNSKGPKNIQPQLSHRSLSVSSQLDDQEARASDDEADNFANGSPKKLPNNPDPYKALSSSGTRVSVGECNNCAFGGPKIRPIDPNLYKVLVNGTKEDVLRLEGTNLWEFKSLKDGNSVLHIAATNSSSSQASLIISDILPMSKNIIEWRNYTGDLAFHSAARAGNMDCLRALTNWRSYENSVQDEGMKKELLGRGNDEGDTPLHIALEHCQWEMGEYLVDEYGEACYKLNKKEVSPVYLAVKAKKGDLVKRMMSRTKSLAEESGDTLLQGKSVVHAAIQAEDIEVLKEILKNHKDLIACLDEERRTPLSYAAFRGYLEGVTYLLKEFPSDAYKADDDKEGSFPIHSAARGGNIQVIKLLLSTKQLLNMKSQSILHIAARNGKSQVVSYLLKIKELEKFVNMKDEDGNTPLHLATKSFQPRVVYILTRDKRVEHELGLQNKDGLTALDVAEIYAESNPTLDERLTWIALRYVNAPRSLQSTRKKFLQKEKLRKQEKQHQTSAYGRQNKKPNDETKEKEKKPNDKNKHERYKDRIDTNLLVATLVATVTFAAGFTLPGGYKQDDPQVGMAVLPHRWAFQVFVICNTAAMYSSLLAVVTLLWAQLGELKLVLVSFRVALPMLGFALAMMSLAFMMGLFVVLRNLPWLSYVVLGIGSFFSVVMLLFFIPLYNPSYIKNRVARFFFSGTFLLLLLVCEKSQIDYI